ncbi:tRNA (adenosine(37)-N6)-threonylcarbamoyltransferase complex dimerization subunit type 1 TsaB [Sneathiella aquimaris]|uniref:tRNA (adenosine(37)-N6)-threonylcarbamoyltransferase complex dimerization subunit type 1 TsaB n=1 Tax=Sneathiella aquimaris TaxID=2599305 RepID=UPI00146EF100|nr:tRNA (adenosine(37)-N6)-threonylcarbamoyltransferase complex dimerization subunit type 1 TsaB [Sneathiella aquimaris]
MKILALDTALNACSVALMENTEILLERSEPRARGHAEKLLPMVRDMMTECQIDFAQLNGIAVSVGPGTFTGLRIGLSAARGMALAAGIPALGITTLEALAASVSADQHQTRPVTIAIDARRQEVYLQSFDPQTLATSPVPLAPARAVPIKNVTDFLPKEPFVLLGSGAGLLQEAGMLRALSFEILDLPENPAASRLGRIAALRGFETATEPPAPLYLRSPDAKLPGGIDPFKGKE